MNYNNWNMSFISGNKIRARTNLEYFCQYHLKNARFTIASTVNDLKIRKNQYVNVNVMYTDYTNFFKEFLRMVKFKGKSWKDMVHKFNNLSSINNNLYTQIVNSFKEPNVIASVSNSTKNFVNINNCIDN